MNMENGIIDNVEHFLDMDSDSGNMQPRRGQIKRFIEQRYFRYGVEFCVSDSNTSQRCKIEGGGEEAQRRARAERRAFLFEITLKVYVCDVQLFFAVST